MEAHIPTTRVGAAGRTKPALVALVVCVAAVVYGVILVGQKS